MNDKLKIILQSAKKNVDKVAIAVLLLFLGVVYMLVSKEQQLSLSPKNIPPSPLSQILPTKTYFIVKTALQPIPTKEDIQKSDTEPLYPAEIAEMDLTEKTLDELKQFGEQLGIPNMEMLTEDGVLEDATGQSIPHKTLLIEIIANRIKYLDRVSGYRKIFTFSLFEQKEVKSESEIIAEAERKFKRAEELYKAKHLRGSIELCKEVLIIWKTHAGARDLLEKAEKELSERFTPVNQQPEGQQIIEE